MEASSNYHSENDNSRGRKYSRDELFSLAKSMKNCVEVNEELNRLEHADWSQQQLDSSTVVGTAVGGNKYSSAFTLCKSVSNLGTNDYSKVSAEKGGANDWRRGSFRTSTARLSRMTSSPSIRYEKSNSTKNQTNLVTNDEVPNQIKSKYARLIESFTNSSGQSRSSVSNAGSTTTQERSRLHTTQDTTALSNISKPVVRPNYLFGSLRKELKTKDRRRSEEPLSSSSTSISASTEKRHLASQGGSVNQFTSLSSSTQQYHSSKTDSVEIVDSNCNEEDEFDITSLVSITVLSDIKTIRQDCAPTKNRRVPVGISGRSSSTLKTRGDSLREPLVRSRTSTDFTYNGRRLGEYEEDRVRANNEFLPKFKHHHQPIQSQTGPSSLPYSYAWNQQQQNTFDTREMAQLEKPATIPIDKKPVDENAAQIIEAFKIQVKERAKKPLPTVAPDSREKVVESEGKASEESKVTELYKSETKRTFATSKNEEEKISEGGDNVADSRKRQESLQAPGTSLDKPAVALVIKDDEKEPVGKEFKQANSQATKPTTSVNHLSQIPRLISLHGLKQINLSKEGEKVLESDEPEKTAASAKPKKFISQYKSLMGKSLADEIEDMPK